ncbi:hypothetical protein B0J11DRAFT_239329 [Dendryphion nanum]|uniref:F-box domain-containing protein n=1 Tax=Dendryphion nanum TaxID=256645 RepID=A0A9P9CXW9_9PLEO|nr:hypothetical protein B0J11DRAFT_239329 [Dendryphion nanum]
MCPSPLPIQGYHISEPTIIKIEIEDSPEPDILEDSTQSAGPLEQQPVTTASRQTVIDPKDPEGFLRRCSGQNKKTRARCSQVIGRNSSNSLKAHSTFLPTCKTHQDQKSFAGWCQFRQDDGERCGRLFRWTPPYFELCEDHQGHPDTPCYLMKLPLELRHEVFRYLLPTESISSSIVPNHRDNAGLHPLPMCMPTWPTTSHSTNANAGPSRRPCRRTSGGVDAVGQSEFNNKRFPFSLIDLLLVSRQFYEEVKDLLYSTAVFTVDIRRDGTYMCGRRVLEPTRPDGSSHAPTSALQQMGKRFVSTFDFKAVKNYNIHILVEDWSLAGHESWDEEVEIYDIRDYIGVTVSGILALARNLCRLNVRIGFAGFKWTQEELLKNMKSLAEPFERLRNVRQPRLCGVFDGFRDRNYMTTISAHSHQNTPYRPNRDLCSVPPLTTDTFLLCPSNTGFELYRAKWEKWVAHTASTSLCQKPPIRAMFTEFKKFYTKLMPIVPEVTFRHGRHAFLHRARVAREHENVEELRHLRNELVQYWCLYLEREEEKKTDMDKQLSSMLETDIYPSQEPENWSRRPSSSSSSPESPTALDAGKMAAEGIPMIQNPQGNMGTFGMSRMMNIPTPHNPQIIRYSMVQQPVELQAMQPQLAMNARQTASAHHVALVKQRQRQLLLQQLQQERMGGQPSHYHSHFTSVQGGQIQHQHQLDAAQAHAASQQPFMPTKLSSTMQV